MSHTMAVSYNIFKNIFNKSKNTQDKQEINQEDKMDKFALISKLPLSPEYNQYKFTPIIHMTDKKPEKGIYFNEEIGCADDIVFYTSREFNKPSNNLAEYIALNINEILENSMMQSSRNLLASKAKYIIFTSNILGYKKNKSIIGVFENKHNDLDENMRLEYEINSYSK
jgi:hypothetical protein